MIVVVIVFCVCVLVCVCVAVVFGVGDWGVVVDDGVCVLCVEVEVCVSAVEMALGRGVVFFGEPGDDVGDVDA